MMTDDLKTLNPPEDEPVSDENQEASKIDDGTNETPGKDPDSELSPSEKPQAISDEVLISRLESLVFVSPTPITVRRLARILSIDGKRVRELLGIIDAQCQNRGIVLQEVSGGFQFRSHPDNAAVIRHVFKLKPLRISRAAMETLAIVAYRQPLTRTEVEAIRGVDCGGTLKYLFEKGLVRIIGRKEEPGRPIIYATSKEFLELFSLKALSNLPALHEFHELWDEHQEILDEQAPFEEHVEEAEDVQQSEPADDEQPESTTPLEDAQQSKPTDDEQPLEKTDFVDHE
jgi:segregation and condensation protein B